MNFLTEILETKRNELEEAKKTVSVSDLRGRAAEMPAPRDFIAALKGGEPSVIAEIKRASPSRGVLTTQFDPGGIAREYEQGGAAAVSVLTDERFFRGRPEDIAAVRSQTALPVLRKDFIIDEYQVFESRVLGADAILLIVRALGADRLQSLLMSARAIGIPAVVEVHDENDLRIANACGARLIGVNNRDLSDFSVSLTRSLKLRSRIRPDAITISESGINDAQDVRALREAGYHAVLVGEKLMTSGNRTEALRKLMGA